MIARLIQPSALVADGALEKMPFGVPSATGRSVQYLFRLNETVLLDHPTYIVHPAIALVITIPALLISAIASVIISAVSVPITALRAALRAGAAVFQVLHNRIVSGVDLLHLFVGNISKGRIGLIVGMIFFRQFPIGRLNLFLGSGSGYAKHLIWIFFRHYTSSICPKRGCKYMFFCLCQADG